MLLLCPALIDGTDKEYDSCDLLLCMAVAAVKGFLYYIAVKTVTEF